MQKQHKALPYPTYDAYKNSGVDWLGEIPEHWEVRRFKYLFEEINIRSYSESADLLSVSQYTGVTRKSDKLGKDAILTNAASLEGYKKVKKGDLVSNIMLAWNGSLGFSPHNGITSPAYAIYRLIHDSINSYFHYLLRTELYKSEFKRNSTGVIESRLRLYTDDFFQIWSILPPKSEQTAIANFLDEKCVKIKQAIAQKEALIKLLQERKQIVIQKAVTKGLDPDVPMKDSGVDWIGEIPEHWEVKKLKYLFKLIGGGTPSKEKLIYWGGTIPWVSPKDMKSDYILDTFDHLTKDGLNSSATKLIKKGSLLMVVRSGILQRVIPVAIAQVDLTLNQDMKAFIPINSLLSKFLFFYIKGNDNELRNEWIKQGATVESVEIDLLRNSLVLIPTMDEQKEIIEFIKTQTTKIDTAIKLQRAQIVQLQAYQRSLIDSAVRGRIKLV